MARDVDKGPDAFRTISEVAEDLDLPQHVLRFWEGRFPQIKPLKRGGGRRYYRPDDVDLLKGIRHLLYGEGYTIRGVQRILKEQGVRAVMAVWQDGAPQPAARPDEIGDDPAYDDDSFGFDDGFAAAPLAAEGEEGDEADEGAASIAQRFAPRSDAAPARSRPNGPAPAASQPQHRDDRRFERLPAGVAPDEPAAEEGRSALGAFIDRLRPGHATPGRAEPESDVPPRLSRDDVRHLQATLFELLECKRLLDQAR
jgi:DNA-binding transcriptional MerR regulator